MAVGKESMINRLSNLINRIIAREPKYHRFYAQLVTISLLQKGYLPFNKICSTQSFAI